MAQTESQMDMPISALSKATMVKPVDLFFMEQDGEGKALTGQVLETWLLRMADGHGGVTGFRKTGTSGLVDTYEFTMADATVFTFTVTNGAKGDKGDKGDKGNTGSPASISSTSVSYAVSTSGTAVPSSWQQTIPSVSPGHYLWTRLTIQFNTGSPIVAYSVSRNGINGSGAVSTVNNKNPDASGNVQLSAADVGARPNTWTPSAQNVGALPASGGTMTGAIAMSGKKITNLGAPTAGTDAANKSYVDTIVTTVTLQASGWSSSAPYTQSVTVPGMTDAKRAKAYPEYGSNNTTNLEIKEASAMVSFAKRSSGTMTFTCLEDKPTANIPVTVEVYV